MSRLNTFAIMNSFNVTIAHNTYRKIKFRYTLIRLIVK